MSVRDRKKGFLLPLLHFTIILRYLVFFPLIRPPLKEYNMIRDIVSEEKQKKEKEKRRVGMVETLQKNFKKFLRIKLSSNEWNLQKNWSESFSLHLSFYFAFHSVQFCNRHIPKSVFNSCIVIQPSFTTFYFVLNTVDVVLCMKLRFRSKFIPISKGFFSKCWVWILISSIITFTLLIVQHTQKLRLQNLDNVAS